MIKLENHQNQEQIQIDSKVSNKEIAQSINQSLQIKIKNQ